MFGGKMFKLSNYFGADDCFLFKLIATSSLVACGIIWLLVS